MDKSSKTSGNRCISCATRLTWIGLWDSLLIAVFKGVIGYLTHSRALLASAFYSVHDVVSSILIIVGLKVASVPVDEEHPFGHGNAEYIVSVFTSFIVLAGTIFLIVDSIKVVMKAEHAPLNWAALAAASISCFANEIIYRYNICAVKHLNSPAIHTHAKHHRADAISSFAVVIAIIGTGMGMYFLDPLVAIFEAAHLTFLSMEILYHGSVGLMGLSAEKGRVSLIRSIASQTPEVKEVKNIRTRQIGRTIWVDLCICISIEKTVIEANKIGNLIRENLKGKIEYLGKVNIIFE